MSRYSRIVIDGNSLCHRYRHSFKELTDHNGNNVGALYGMINTVTRLLTLCTPDEVVVAWDSPTCWRVSFCKTYKAARTLARKNYDAEEEERYKRFVKEEVPQVQRILHKIGIPQLCRSGFEADDIIAVLSSDEVPDAISTTIISSDSDLLQLVSHRVSVYQPTIDLLWTLNANGLLSPNTIEESDAPVDKSKIQFKHVSPKLYLWIKAFIGDTSDSIQGIRGIGPVTALKLFHSEPLPNQSFDDYYNMMLSQAAKDPKTAVLTQRLKDIDAVSTIKRNLRLMDLKFEHSILHKLRAHRSAIVELNTQDGLNLDSTHFGKWLTCGVTSKGLSLKAPFFLFFHHLGFSFASSPVSAFEVLSEYQTLTNRRNLLYDHLALHGL